MKITWLHTIRNSSRTGFTLIEMLLVMAIMMTLIVISSVLLTNLIPKASLTSATEVLIADLRQQQLKAMVGETEGSGTTHEYGIRIEPHQYVLFRDTTYVANSPNNFAVLNEDPLQLSSTFPNSQIVFAKGSGQIVGYDPNADTITITNTAATQSVILEFNRYGVITSIN